MSVGGGPPKFPFSLKLMKVIHIQNPILTLASNAWLKMSQSCLANVSDFPVSVAYKMVAVIRAARALPIRLAANFTALKHEK